MGNWCLQHPYLTFFLVWVLIDAIRAIIKYLTKWHLTDAEAELKMLEKELDKRAY